MLVLRFFLQTVGDNLTSRPKRGDVDHFHIEWETHNGYIREEEQWSMEVIQHTQNLSLEVVFPAERLPHRVIAIEQYRGRTKTVQLETNHTLADGRLKVVWYLKRPKYTARYSIRWQW